MKYGRHFTHCIARHQDQGRGEAGKTVAHIECNTRLRQGKCGAMSAPEKATATSGGDALRRDLPTAGLTVPASPRRRHTEIPSHSGLPNAHEEVRHRLVGPR